MLSSAIYLTATVMAKLSASQKQSLTIINTWEQSTTVIKCYNTKHSKGRLWSGGKRHSFTSSTLLFSMHISYTEQKWKMQIPNVFSGENWVCSLSLLTEVFISIKPRPLVRSKAMTTPDFRDGISRQKCQPLIQGKTALDYVQSAALSPVNRNLLVMAGAVRKQHQL